MAAFGTDDQEAICVRILAEGELQVGRRGLTSGLHENNQIDSQTRITFFPEGSSFGIPPLSSSLVSSRLVMRCRCRTRSARCSTPNRSCFTLSVSQ